MLARRVSAMRHARVLVPGLLIGLVLAGTIVYLRVPIGGRPTGRPVPERPVHPPEPATSPPPAPTQPRDSSVADIDEIVKRLDWGNIAFNTPSTMQYAEAAEVVLLLSPNLSPTELEAQLQHLGGTVTATIRISERMEAHLTGPGFAIEAITTELQAIPGSSPTRWAWAVTPTETGTLKLHLTLNAHITVAGLDTPLQITTFYRDIKVEVPFVRRVGKFGRENWQWLWATLLVPVMGYWWRRRKNTFKEPKRE